MLVWQGKEIDAAASDQVVDPNELEALMRQPQETWWVSLAGRTTTGQNVRYVGRVKLRPYLGSRGTF